MTLPPIPVHLPAFSVAGLAVRTCNRDEADPAIARIGGLWDRFFSQSWERALPRPGAGPGDDWRLFGVYSAYESDEHGAFDVTAGVAVALAALARPDAAWVEVQAGDYLVFSGQGAMPQGVIDTWGAIWRYFTENPQLRRRFGTDFEAYEGPDRVAIHIGVV